MPDVYIRRIPEIHVLGKRLGRHVRHDPRSLAYQYPAADLGSLKSVRHERHVPVLNQGALGSCTGNAAEGCVGTGVFLAAVPDSNPAKPTGDVSRDELQAVALYSAATQLDDVPGSYPPDDTGSNGLSVAKAAKNAGLISGYQHATSLEAALTALAVQPVITGVNWYDSFDSPDADGNISITASAVVRGGHEFVLDELDVEHQRVGFTNSWGADWGVQGRAYLSWADFGRLLGEQGDVTVFVPVTQPAPVPTPPTPPGPAPADPLHELVDIIKSAFQAFERWRAKHGL